MAALIGMKAIQKHFSRSEATIIKLVDTEKFPAVKKDGIWTSSEEMINKWLDKSIEDSLGVDTELFRCEKCGRDFRSKAARTNHMKTCVKG